jgi:hypothetical protein
MVTKYSFLLPWLMSVSLIWCQDVIPQLKLLSFLFDFDFSADDIEVGGQVKEVAGCKCACFTLVHTTTTHVCELIGFVWVWDD